MGGFFLIDIRFSNLLCQFFLAGAFVTQAKVSLSEKELLSEEKSIISMFAGLLPSDILQLAHILTPRATPISIPLPPSLTASPRAVNELSRGDPSIPGGIQLSMKIFHKEWTAVTTSTRTCRILGR